jgi:hypothetical protein
MGQADRPTLPMSGYSTCMVSKHIGGERLRYLGLVIAGLGFALIMFRWANDEGFSASGYSAVAVGVVVFWVALFVGYREMRKAAQRLREP